MGRSKRLKRDKREIFCEILGLLKEDVVKEDEAKQDKVRKYSIRRKTNQDIHFVEKLFFLQKRGFIKKEILEDGETYFVITEEGKRIFFVLRGVYNILSR